MNQGTTLITGASGGIGRELARVFAAHGHELILAGRNRKRLLALARELNEVRDGVRATVLTADLGKPEGAKTLFDSVRRRKIDVEILVNNAGAMSNGDFADIPLAAHLDVIHVNVVAPTVLPYLFLGAMLERGHGRILHVASMAGFQAIPRLAVYAASKAYGMHLAEALSEEVAGTGVTVTALCPGFTRTGILSQAPDAARLPPFAVGSPADVALDGYRACMNAIPLQVSGLANQLAAQAIRYQPRWLARSIAGAIARRNK